MDSQPRARNSAATTPSSPSTSSSTSSSKRRPSLPASYRATDRALDKPKHGLAMEGVRIVAFTIYFMTSILSIHAAQILGLPLYYYNRPWYRAWVAMTKEYFGVHITNMTAWWSPHTVRISGDRSVAGLLRQGKDGLVTLDFGPRVLLIANHQLYTDWLYLWWAAYTNIMPMHGHIYIILKETLKWTPIVGPAMQLYGFIFMARKWSSDQTRLREGLRRLAGKAPDSSDESPQAAVKPPTHLDPMWLLIFPEGTNLTGHERAKTEEYCIKTGKENLKHQVLPRPAGLHLLLQELASTVPYVYDCTVGYYPLPPGGYGCDSYGLRTVYVQGRPPVSVNMHWRRFAVADIPYQGDKAQLQDWLEARWREKDALLEAFYRDGKFPGDTAAVQIEGGPPEGDAFKTPYITTEIRTRSPWEFTNMFMPLAAAIAVGRVVVQLVGRFLG